MLNAECHDRHHHHNRTKEISVCAFNAKDFNIFLNKLNPSLKYDRRAIYYLRKYWNLESKQHPRHRLQNLLLWRMFARLLLRQCIFEQATNNQHIGSRFYCVSVGFSQVAEREKYWQRENVCGCGFCFRWSTFIQCMASLYIYLYILDVMGRTKTRGVHSRSPRALKTKAVSIQHSHSRSGALCENRLSAFCAS